MKINFPQFYFYHFSGSISMGDLAIINKISMNKINIENLPVPIN
jgi:hypothetical protein